MSTNSISPSLLKTKQHFEILDGLRGVAALAIVLFHFMEMAIFDYSKNFIAHGYLAVDFFFCLSGFVIAYAYDDRIGKMGIVEFFKSRAIRLHPLVVLGSVLGLLTFLYDPFSTYKSVYDSGRMALIFIASIFVIPFPISTERSFNLFTLNAPAWSLFWEYIANIVYALVLVRLNKKILTVLIAIAAVSLCFVVYRAGSVVGGWSGPTFWDGGSRIFYSFLAGLLIFRYNLIIKNKLGFLGAAILLSFAFLMPYADKWNWLTETIAVLIYFPLIVSLGAGASLSSGLKKLCNFAGNISYPLYMTHYCVIWVFLNYLTMYKPATDQWAPIVAVGTISLVGFAYLVMVLYDIPVRRWLSSKRGGAGPKAG